MPNSFSITSTTEAHTSRLGSSRTFSCPICARPSNHFAHKPSPSTKGDRHEYDRNVRSKHHDSNREIALHGQGPHHWRPGGRRIPYVGWPAGRKAFRPWHFR